MINSRTLNEIYGTVRDSTSVHTESRLDLAERILKPKTLADFADQNALQRLQAKFLAGEQSRRKKPRSAHTVRGYMNSVLSAVNWAYLQGWLPTAPKLRKIKTSKQKVMNGRPITVDEFRKVLDATGKVVGEDAAESWKHVLRGLWSSALRLDELMHVSWDKPGSIRPVWKVGQLAVLEIPAAMQKNDTGESIPLLPWFEAVLTETPVEQRPRWVFNLTSLQTNLGRKPRHQRPDAEWVGKVIARIGKEAGIENPSAVVSRWTFAVVWTRFGGGRRSVALLSVVLGVELPSLRKQLILGRVVCVHDDRADDPRGHVRVVFLQVGEQHLHRTAPTRADPEQQNLFGTSQGLGDDLV